MVQKPLDLRLTGHLTAASIVPCHNAFISIASILHTSLRLEPPFRVRLLALALRNGAESVGNRIFVQFWESAQG